MKKRANHLLKIMAVILIVLSANVSLKAQLTIYDGLDHEDIMTLSVPADSDYPEGFMVVSTSYNTNGVYVPVVTRVDMSGNILWERKISDPSDPNREIRVLSCNYWYGDAAAHQVEGIILGGFSMTNGVRLPYLEIILLTGADGHDIVMNDFSFNGQEEAAFHYVMQSRSPIRNNMSNCNIIAVGVVTTDFLDQTADKRGLIMGFSGDLLQNHYQYEYNSTISPTSPDSNDFDNFTHVEEIHDWSDPSKVKLFVTGSKNAKKHLLNGAVLNKQITLSLMLEEDISQPISTVSVLWDKSFSNTPLYWGSQHNDLGVKSVQASLGGNAIDEIVILGKESETHSLSLTRIDINGNILHYKNFQPDANSEKFCGFDLQMDYSGSMPFPEYIVSGYVPAVNSIIKILHPAIHRFDYQFNNTDGRLYHSFGKTANYGIPFYHKYTNSWNLGDEWPNWYFNHNGALTNLEQGVLLAGYRNDATSTNEDRQIYLVNKIVFSQLCNNQANGLVHVQKSRVIISGHQFTDTKTLIDEYFLNTTEPVAVNTTTDMCAGMLPLRREKKSKSEELEEESPVRLFPNPTTDFIQLEGLKKASASLKLYDLSGKLLLEKFITDRESLSVNLSELKEGVYFIHLLQNEEEKVFKLLKK